MSSPSSIDTQLRIGVFPVVQYAFDPKRIKLPKCRDVSDLLLDSEFHYYASARPIFGCAVVEVGDIVSVLECRAMVWSQMYNFCGGLLMSSPQISVTQFSSERLPKEGEGYGFWYNYTVNPGSVNEDMKFAALSNWPNVKHLLPDLRRYMPTDWTPTSDYSTLAAIASRSLLSGLVCLAASYSKGAIFGADRASGGEITKLMRFVPKDGNVPFHSHRFYRGAPIVKDSGHVSRAGVTHGTTTPYLNHNSGSMVTMHQLIVGRMYWGNAWVGMDGAEFLSNPEYYRILPQNLCYN